MSAAVAPNKLLSDKLREWEVVFEHPLSEVELKVWYESFGDLRVSDAVLSEALKLVQSKSMKMPKPGHLTAALDVSRETIRAARPPEPPPAHISEMSKAEREELARKFREDMTRALNKVDLRPAARSPEAARVEANRQKGALRASQNDAVRERPTSQTSSPVSPAPAPAPGTASVEPGPDSIPYEATDDDLPEGM